MRFIIIEGCESGHREKYIKALSKLGIKKVVLTDDYLKRYIPFAIRKSIFWKAFVSSFVILREKNIVPIFTTGDDYYLGAIILSIFKRKNIIIFHRSEARVFRETCSGYFCRLMLKASAYTPNEYVSRRWGGGKFKVNLIEDPLKEEIGKYKNIEKRMAVLGMKGKVSPEKLRFVAEKLNLPYSYIDSGVITNYQKDGEFINFNEISLNNDQQFYRMISSYKYFCIDSGEKIFFSSMVLEVIYLGSIPIVNKNYITRKLACSYPVIQFFESISNGEAKDIQDCEIADCSLRVQHDYSPNKIEKIIKNVI